MYTFKLKICFKLSFPDTNIYFHERLKITKANIGKNVFDLIAFNIKWTLSVLIVHFGI